MEREPANKTIHLLVAGSEEMLQLVISRVLKDAGYNVTTVQDGLEALYTINTFQITQNPFDLLVLDENLVKLSWLELLKKLELLNIPIPLILIRAKNNGDPADLLPTIQMSSLEIPVTKDELLSSVRSLIENKNMSDPTLG